MDILAAVSILPAAQRLVPSLVGTYVVLYRLFKAIHELTPY